MVETRTRRTTTEPAANSSSQVAAAVAGNSILIVDDEPLIRDTLAEYLTQEGYLVAACANGAEALALAGKRRFGVALCDVQLPGMDGLALLERLRRISPETFVLVRACHHGLRHGGERRRGVPARRT
jgi:CheY-like chemotaxis protein